MESSRTPILVVNYCVEGLDTEHIINNVKSIQRLIEKSDVNEEYYTFVLPVTSDSYVQVFYEKDFDEIKYEELKKIIQNKMDELEKNQTRGKLLGGIFG